MKKLTMTLILICLLITTSAIAGFVEIKKYFADYTIYASIKPMMSNDGLSVLSWQSAIRIQKYVGSANRYLKLWTNSETNILNFDLTEPADRTISEFITPAASWLEAQQDMFVNAYAIAQKINKADAAILPAIVFAPINFTNTENVKLIDTGNGILPTGEMIATPISLPGAFETLSPANAAMVSTPSVTLTWTPSARATSYRVKYWADSNSANAITATTSATSYNITVIVGSSNKWYDWQVTAINDDGETEAFASPYFITHQ